MKDVQRLGFKARDILTGYEGTVVCLVEHEHNSPRIGIKSAQLHEGRPIDAEFFDESTVIVDYTNPPVMNPVPPMERKFNIGDKVKHNRQPKVKGFIVAISLWTTGCWRVCVQTEELKDGAPVEVWLPEGELSLVEEAPPKPKKKDPPGGPMSRVPEVKSRG